jgi:hypothetical protein
VCAVTVPLLFAGADAFAYTSRIAAAVRSTRSFWFAYASDTDVSTFWKDGIPWRSSGGK